MFELKPQMVFDSGHAKRQIAFGIVGSLHRAFNIRARQQIVAGNLQRVSQKAERLQARLTQSALIQSHRVQALADHIG